MRMTKTWSTALAVATCLISSPAFSQDEPRTIAILQLGSFVPGVAGISPGALARASRNFVNVTPDFIFVPFDQFESVEIEFQRPGVLPLHASTLPDTPSSVLLVIPRELTPGPVRAAFVLNGEVQEFSDFLIRDRSPGLFSRGNLFQGPAVAQNLTDDGPVSNAHTRPALPNQTVTLWGTGLGEVTAADVTVTVADQEVPADFAGSAGTPGLDQINFRMPANPFFGCYVPVSITVAGTPSGTVTLSIRSTLGDCNHPLGFSHDDLAALDVAMESAHGDLVRLPSVGAISLARILSGFPGYGGGLREQINVAFSTPGNLSSPFNSSDLSDLFRLAGVQIPDSMFFGCEVPQLNIINPIGVVGGFGTGQVNPEETIQFFGPGGRQIDVGHRMIGGSGNFFRHDFEFLALNASPSLLAPGSWMISAPSRSGIAAFQQPFHLPPTPRLMGRTGQPIHLQRNADNVITWDPEGYQPDDIISLQMSTGFRSFNCRVRATEGQVVIPRVLMQAPPQGQSPLGSGQLNIQVVPYPPSRKTFDIPLEGGGAMRGVIDFNLFGGVRDIVLQ